MNFSKEKYCVWNIVNVQEDADAELELERILNLPKYMTVGANSDFKLSLKIIQMVK